MCILSKTGFEAKSFAEEKTKEHQLHDVIIGSGSVWSLGVLSDWRAELNNMSLITCTLINKKSWVNLMDSWTKKGTSRLCLLTCDINPWTCSTVIFALSRVILASGSSSWKWSITHIHNWALKSPQTNGVNKIKNDHKTLGSKRRLLATSSWRIDTSKFYQIVYLFKLPSLHILTK